MAKIERLSSPLLLSLTCSDVGDEARHKRKREEDEEARSLLLALQKRKLQEAAYDAISEKPECKYELLNIRADSIAASQKRKREEEESLDASIIVTHKQKLEDAGDGVLDELGEDDKEAKVARLCAGETSGTRKQKEENEEVCDLTSALYKLSLPEGQVEGNLEILRREEGQSVHPRDPFDFYKFF